MSCHPDCNCPACNEELARVMRMDPVQYSDWLNRTQRQIVRFNRAARVFRTAGPAAAPPPDEDARFEPPDPYGIADKMKAAKVMPRLPEPPPLSAEDAERFAPPDPYRLGEPKTAARERKITALAGPGWTERADGVIVRRDGIPCPWSTAIFGRTSR